MSLGVLILFLGALSIVPYGQYCDVPQEGGQEYCSAHNLLSAGVVYLIGFFSDFAVAITGFATIAIAAFTATLWRATSRMQSATSATLEHLKREFTAEHRPWITMECKVGATLAFSDNEWSLPIFYAIKNLGRSPAINVSFAARLLPWETWVVVNRTDQDPFGQRLPGTDVMTELNAVSEFSERIIRDSTTGNWGHVLFPTEFEERPWKPLADQKAFEAAASSPAYSGSFLLVASVVYGSTLGDALFRTAKAYGIWKANGARLEPRGEEQPIPVPLLVVNLERSYAT